MKAVVTGAAGFIGSTLCDQLLTRGAWVRGVDAFTPYYDPGTKRHNVSGLLADPHGSLVEADLATLDDHRLNDLLVDADVVFHLAAQPGVRGSWAAGFADYEVHNIHATQRLLEAVRRVGVPRLVYASSSSVYGNAPHYPTIESHPTRPFSPYGVTKLAGEHLCSAYADNFGVRTVALRYFTVYGPRQRPDMATHRLIEAARDGSSFPLFGDGSQRRDFTFVGDVVLATIAAAEADVPSGSVFNVAGGSSATLLDVVGFVGEAVGRPVHIDWRPAEPGDVAVTGASSELARSRLGWTPQVPLAEGIARQVAWHMARSDR